MTVGEAIQQLQKYDANAELKIVVRNAVFEAIVPAIGTGMILDGISKEMQKYT